MNKKGYSVRPEMSHLEEHYSTWWEPLLRGEGTELMLLVRSQMSYDSRRRLRMLQEACREEYMKYVSC